MAEDPANPHCPRCGGASWKLGFNTQGRQRYVCRACRRTFSGATVRLLKRRRAREERRRLSRLSERLRRARTLAEFVGVIDARVGRAIARSPALGGLVRRGEYARRKGVSREYVRRLVKEDRLLTARVCGVEWVSEREP